MPTRTAKTGRTGKTTRSTKKARAGKTARTRKAEAAAKAARTDTRPRASTADPAYSKAPGKRHRQPPPNMHGAKKSDTTIPNLMVAELNRIRKPYS